jgi:hypothetical protein
MEGVANFFSINENNKAFALFFFLNIELLTTLLERRQIEVPANQSQIIRT